MNSNVRTRVVLKCFIAVGLFFICRSAAAQTWVYNPYYTATHIVVGYRSATGNTEVLFWRASDQNCTETVLGGSSGLNGDYFVNGSVQNDVMVITSNATGNLMVYCSNFGSWVTLTNLSYNYHYVDLFGFDGDDWLESGLAANGTFIYGEDGNDYLKIDTDTFASGDWGNDTIQSVGVNASNEYLVGGDTTSDGNDKLCDASGAAAYVECGAGTDRTSLSSGMNCETTSYAYSSCTGP